MMIHKGTFLLLCLLTVSACTTTRYVSDLYADWERQTPPSASELAYRVFLIGDGGAAGQTKPALQLLKKQLRNADKNTAVVFLGDNIYCCGLADSGTVRRAQDEQRLLAQLDVVKDFPGRIVVIPGNHDWNNARPGGLEAVARQEQFVETYLDRGNVFLPDDGFPGPVKVKLTDRLSLIAIDTQWWLDEYDKSFGDNGDYDLQQDDDFLLELDDLLKRNDDDDLIIVGHHPIFTNGIHAGIHPLRDHLFPLRNIHPALLIPLPIIGSIYPLYVRFNGGRQNIYHPRYKALRRSLLQVFSQHENLLVYAAGHDHTLQYFPVIPVDQNQPHHFIVSGAGSAPQTVGRGRGAAFTAGNTFGFSVIDYYRDGTTWMEMWKADPDDASGTLLFKTQLKGPARELVNPEIPPVVNVPDYADSTVTEAVNPNYAAGPIKEFFLGKHHRDDWTTPVTAPVLDLGTEDGGLTIGKRGGGQQTISLRLTDPNDHQYALRSIDKDPSKTVPVNLQGTIATDIVQDQITSIHPFGAFIIPPLADAAGVYHTNPRLFYVPDDPRLGIYRQQFGDKMMMLEERPDGDMSDDPSFGRSRDIISPQKLYREINDDNDHRVDARAFARARLFDMLLSDWDRHSDQWRWASFEPYELDSTLTGDARTDGKIYRPIPRDRDFAFNKMDGLFPSLASQFDPRFQDFTKSYGYLKGLNLNGLRQDRRFVSPLSRQDFIEIADSLKAALTDAVIDEAVRQWPKPIYDLDGAETARLLKIRRDKLPRVAEAYYEIHARVVDVVGSNKHERFEVTRLDDDSTRVVVYKTSKQGEKRKVIYDRTLLRSETKEVRLYGLDGNDTFVVDGDVGAGITVRAVGGPGNDTFIDHSHVRGGGKKTRYYDTETGNSWDVDAETKLTRSDDDPAVNYYNPYEYQYNLALPLLFLGSNKDDGFFLGGGVNIVRHGFRKEPYATDHKIKANVAAKTLAFNVVYGGHYVDVFGHWDVMFDAAYLSPNNIRNFYGLGNRTENDARDREFYQARLTQFRVSPTLYKDIEQGATFRLGPSLQVTDVDEKSDRFVNQPQAGISENTFSTQVFGGFDAEVVVDTRDNAINPRQGFRWTNLAQLNIGLRNTKDTFVSLSSDLSFYLSPSLYAPQITLAARIGTAHNVSDFPFYSANTLGGRTNLRGFRSTRFAGRTSFYQNLELRMSLLRFSTYLAIGRLGLLAYLDNGRVWTEADDPINVSQAFLEGYHQGYGGGLWTEMFNIFVITATADFSNDENGFTLKMGFQY